jgi:hypothetical protein
MPNAPLPPLAVPADLAGRLQQATPTDPVVVAAWESALADASSDVRDAVGQPITPGTATLDVPVNQYGHGLIPMCPVTGVTAVVDPSGVTLPGDGTGYRIDGQRMFIYRRYMVGNPNDRALDPMYRVTVNHGWDPIPGELLKWVYVLAAAQLAAVGLGHLGISGGLTSVAVDDGRATFASGASVEIPDRQIARLRAMYGGEA